MIFLARRIEKIRVPERDGQLKIRRAKDTDLPVLIDINEKSFGDYFGRYHADPQMPAGTATRVYTEWIRSAFQGWADWVLIFAELDAQIAAYGIWRKALAAEERICPRVAHYDLAAMDPRISRPWFVDGSHARRHVDRTRLCAISRRARTHCQQLSRSALATKIRLEHVRLQTLISQMAQPVIARLQFECCRNAVCAFS